MNNILPNVKVWGLTVPGRPKTPSDGHAQSYTRFGFAGNQALLTFDNGTCLAYGPDDPVFEYGPGHPFGNQILNIDKAIRDVKSAREGHERPGAFAQSAFNDFRINPVHPQYATAVNAGDFRYLQVPSKNASLQSTPSVYGMANKSDTPGLNHPGFNTDTRFGVMQPNNVNRPGAMQRNHGPRHGGMRRNNGPPPQPQNRRHRTTQPNRRALPRPPLPPPQQNQTNVRGYGGGQYGTTGLESGYNGQEEEEEEEEDNVSDYTRQYSNTSRPGIFVPAPVLAPADAPPRVPLPWETPELARRLALGPARSAPASVFGYRPPSSQN